MREETEGRPALSFGIGLVLGILTVPSLWAALGALAALVWIRPVGARAGLCIAFAVGIFLSPPPAELSPSWRSSHLISAIGTVVSAPNLYKSTTSANVATDVGVFRVVAEGDLAFGEEIRFTGEVKPIREGMERTSSFRGVAGIVYVEKRRLAVVRPAALPYQWGQAWKRSFVDFSNEAVGPDEGRIVRALTFNIDEGLDPEFRSNLQRTGTIHIISASGAHVLIFAVSMLFVLSFVPIPRAWHVPVLIGVLAVYALAAGFRPPIVRAVAMAALSYSAYLFRKEPDLLSALALSLIAYLLFQPASVYDIGFQLSFVTVGALALFGKFDLSPAWGLAGAIRRQAATVLRASWVAWAGSAPLVAYHFGALSLIAVPANFAIAILIAPVMMLAMASHACSFVIEPLAAGTMRGVVAPLAAALRGIVDLLGNVPFASVQIPEFSPWWVVLYYAIALALWRPRARPA